MHYLTTGHKHTKTCTYHILQLFLYIWKQYFDIFAKLLRLGVIYLHGFTSVVGVILIEFVVL